MSTIDTRCGTTYRTEQEERKGPRGGRRTALRLQCARCGRRSAWRISRRPGSFDEVTGQALAELHAVECQRPYVPSDATRLLTDLAALIRKRETITLAFAVEHSLAGTTLADAAVKAWNECDDGHAMGQLIAARETYVKGYASGPSLYPDGRVHLSFGVRDGRDRATVSLTGSRELVAHLLRTITDKSSVRNIAKLAEQKEAAA